MLSMLSFHSKKIISIIYATFQVRFFTDTFNMKQKLILRFCFRLSYIRTLALSFRTPLMMNLQKVKVFDQKFYFVL